MKQELNRQAKKNFDEAAALVVRGKFTEARAVELEPSDRGIIEKRIINVEKTNAKD